MDQDGCGIPVPLATGVRRGIDDYSFVPFMNGGAFDSVRAYLEFFTTRKVEFNYMSVCDLNDWFCITFPVVNCRILLRRLFHRKVRSERGAWF